MSDKESTPIILALDFADERTALNLVDQLEPQLCKLKVGKELFTRSGPQFVERLIARGYDVFLDLKFHDIPNTVAGAIAICADLGVWMVNVHCSGGSRMLLAAKQELQKSGSETLLIGVTVLTSMAQEDLSEIGVNRSPEEQVVALAALAFESGLDGIVCSGREAGVIRTKFGEEFLRVTPGIRPSVGNVSDDQRRTLTPRDALAGGSSYLVIGRPITAAENPLAALLAIRQEIEEDV